MTVKKGDGLTPPKSAAELLDLYYLEARSHLLEAAAALDRIERAQGGAETMEESRVQNLLKICDLISTKKQNRAQEVLTLLSV